MTQIEKALKILIRQIKELDENTLALDVLGGRTEILASRMILFDVIEKNGYELTTTYKLIKKAK
jgi:hypothetical protein